MVQEIVPFQILEKNISRWTSLLEESLYPNYLQTFEYANSRTTNKRKVFTYIFNVGGHDVTGVHYSISKSWLGLFTTADIHSGYVFKFLPSIEIFEQFINHFIQFAKSNNASYMRFSPWLPINVDENKIDYYSRFNNILISKGFRIIKDGRHTYWINLNLPQSELLQNMKSNTRRMIRKAEKSDISIEYLEEYQKQKVDIYYTLYSQLSNRKGFKALPQAQFYAEVKALMKSGATLCIIKYQDKIINVALATHFGIGSYYHGAHNPDYKQMEGCPSSGHLMQWLLIKHLKNKGISTYDMAFCPGPIPIKDHQKYNIWRFKFDFGGTHIQYSPTYGKIINPIIGGLFYLIRYSRTCKRK